MRTGLDTKLVPQNDVKKFVYVSAEIDLQTKVVSQNDVRKFACMSAELHLKRLRAVVTCGKP